MNAYSLVTIQCFHITTLLLGHGTKYICVAILLAVLCGLSGAYSVHKGVDRNFDLRYYHFYNAFGSLNNRYEYDIAPANIGTYVNPTLDFPFYFLVENLNERPKTIAFLLGTVNGDNLLLIGLLAWYFIGQFRAISFAERAFLGTLTLLIAATGAGSRSLVGTTTGDLPAAVPILLALLIQVRAIDAAETNCSDALRRLKLSGIVAGIAVGLKLTMAPYVIALAVTLVTIPRRLLLRASIRFGAYCTVGIMLSGGWHYARMWHLYRNPIFPMYNKWFRSPFWEFSNFSDPRFFPKTPVQWFLYPFEWSHYGTLVAQIPFRDIRIALAISLAGAAIVTFWARVLKGDRWRPTRGLYAAAIFAVVSYSIWLSTFAQYRYLVALELFSSIIIIVSDDHSDEALCFVRDGLRRHYALHNVDGAA